MNRWHRSPIRAAFSHIGFIFVFALIICGAALGLVMVENALEAFAVPPWFLYGMRVISICLFVVDGILVVGTSAITTVKTGQ